MWLEGFALALSVKYLGWLLAGTVVGLVVGVLPGVGANLGCAVALPFTLGMDTASAIVFLCAIHAAANYGDSIASILLNIPGGPGTVATCWDGHPMARQGRAGRALGIATYSSFIGGAVTWLSLALLAAPIRRFALAIGGPEYFALGVMALGLISVASRGETIKGLIMACLGLLLSCVGPDKVTGLTYRFAFGVPSLEGGLPVVIAVLGVFAIAQVIELLEQGGTVAKAIDVTDSVFRGALDVLRRPITLLRSGLVGWFVGILPALGVSVAGIASYLVEKRYSPAARRFGQGAPEGLIAAEVGKGACVVGDLVPTFLLGVPGSVTGAILLAALVLHGIEPGPQFLASGVLAYIVFAGLLLAQASFLISGLFFGRAMARIVYMPLSLVAPVVAVLCVVGAYAERNYLFDLVILLVFGVIAYALDKLGYPLVCLVLGLILGPVVEANLHRALAIKLGSWTVFLDRPIALVMFLVTVIFLAGPYLVAALGKKPLVGHAKTGSPTGRPTVGELLMLILTSMVFVVFLLKAQYYVPRVRLFPMVVGVPGLGLTLYRLAAEFLQWRRARLRQAKEESRVVRFAEFPWVWPVATVGAYVGLVYLVGMVISSAIYVAAVARVSGYRGRARALLLGVAVGVAVFYFGRLLRVVLPKGLLGLV